MSAPASLWQIWVIFTRLGLTSFGGPSAHVAYFHDEFVTQRKWLTEHEFAQDNALCQIVPGPASSQLGMLIGARQQGLWGSLVAWLGFTMPSALVMLAVMWGSHWLSAYPTLTQGLLLAAACAVTHAIWSMARVFCQTRTTQLITVACTIVPLLWAVPWIQFACICGAATLSAFLIQQTTPVATPVSIISKRTSIVLLTLFGVLCVASLLIASPLSMLYQTGALVFGGGHVMLPLLQARLVNAGYLTTVALLQGYASVQIVPGPLFSIGAYVGGITMGGNIGAALAGLIVIFLPGWLLIMGVMPWWSAIQAHPRVQHGFVGIQAAVVGILAATLIDPIIPAAIHSNSDIVIWMLGVTVLLVVRWPAWIATLMVVLVSVVVGVLE
ncbi:MAG: hypothetical protein RL076_1363 [Chloroflexota bacterium]|jgi:chromate transporter